ncbi:EAL domain-containing protein [Nitrincola alkalilacustris]|uniref:EAL domain-containing protein n=1 Tax=Nitrincola alkalilacustris TaxID=1571224 RepID=UPI00124F5063|nr:EAL domain-containing protein [Nitrincola alkalilacustris]
MRITLYLATLLILLLAMLLSITGYLIPGESISGQIVPLWVPLGIGLTAVLHYGRSLLPSRKKRKTDKRLRLALQLSAVLLSVVGLNQLYMKHLDEQVGRAFQQDVRVLDAQIQAIVQQNLAELASLEQLVMPGRLVDPVAFRQAVLNLQASNPSVLAYSWDPVVLRAELEIFERRTRRILNDPDYAVYGESIEPDDPIIPVQFVEPLEHNRPALGFNLLSIEDRRNWVMLAQSLGRPVVTQILNLTQAPDEPGLLILHPVYTLLEPNHLLMGNKQLSGYMVGVFTVQRMFDAALMRAGIQNIEFSLYEQNMPDPFFQTLSDVAQQEISYEAFFDVEFAQQRWRIRAVAGPEYRAQHPVSSAQLMQTLLVLVGCLGGLLILGMHDRERLLLEQVNRQTRNLAYQARHDDLTGLPNRLRLTERVQERFTVESSEPFSVLFIDLDRFKLINDSLGHQVGDQLLKQMSAHLQLKLVEGSELFRTGGDEFILLVSGEREHVHMEAERFIYLCSLPLQVEQHHLQVTASIGISHYPEHGQDLDTLIKHADTAMYRAKARGKNCFEVYNPVLTDAAVEAFQLEQDLRVALHEKQLLLHFQPQYSLQDRSICGFEALVRWQHPVKGLLPPGQFIPLAEETNLIVQLGWQVIEMACEQILTWQKEGMVVPPVAVNISPPQLLEMDFIQHINRIVDRYQVPRGLLELEITESLILQDPDMSIDLLGQLRQAGYRLALDDFGTGYSSLSRLKQLPLDRLKIDYSFTRDIGKNPKDEAVILTVIALGHSLQIEVLAEGVETQEQYEFLKLKGCNSVQGFLLGRPVSADQCWQSTREVIHKVDLKKDSISS